MYAQLGDVVFNGLIGPSSFSSGIEAKYAEQERIESKPRLQRTGEGLRDISLGIKFHSSYCNPEAQLSTLEGHRSTGEVLAYIRGDGSLLGSFVITSINYVVNQHDTEGRFIDIDVDLKLKEYIDSSSENQTQNEGFASTDQDPLESVQNANSLGDAQLLGVQTNELFDGSGQIDNALKAGTIDPDTEAVQLAKVVKQADQMQVVVDEIDASANKPSIFDISADLRAILNDVRTAIQNIRDFAAVADFENAKLAASNFDIIKQNIRVASAGITANGSTRSS